MVAVGALAAIATAAVVGILALTSDSAAPTSELPGTLVRIDAATNAVTARHPIPGRPGNLVVASGDVWMADFFEGVLWRYSPSTKSLRRVTSNGEPRDLAAIGNQLYVAADAGFFSGNVSRYDATTGIRRDEIAQLACAIASGDGVVWMAGCPSVQRLSTDARPIRKLRDVFLPFNEPGTAENNRVQFRELAIGAGSLWVLGDALDRRVWRLDARTGDVRAEIRLDFPPRSAAVGGGVLWVTDSLGDTLGRIDVASNRLLGRLEVGRLPGGVAVGAGSVWVPNALDGSVLRLDVDTGERQEIIDVGGFPREVAFADGAVWVTGYEG
jgi:DNA-binding beta-propeller fold protein YncE